MPEVDTVREFNVTNATIPNEQGNGINTNFMVMRIDIDIYQETITYFNNIDVSNSYGFYPSLLIDGNLQSKFFLNGFTASNSIAVFAIAYIRLFDYLEVNNLYFENIDATQNFVFESSFITNIKMSNITINNNDISSSDSTGIF